MHSPNNQSVQTCCTRIYATSHSRLLGGHVQQCCCNLQPSLDATPWPGSPPPHTHLNALIMCSGGSGSSGLLGSLYSVSALTAPVNNRRQRGRGKERGARLWCVAPCWCKQNGATREGMVGVAATVPPDFFCVVSQATFRQPCVCDPALLPHLTRLSLRLGCRPSCSAACACRFS